MTMLSICDLCRILHTYIHTVLKLKSVYELSTSTSDSDSFVDMPLYYHYRF